LKVIWCDNAWFPYSYGFCPNEAAWRKEVKRLGVPHLKYPAADAMCTHMENTDKNLENRCTLVTVGHIKRPARTILSLLVHEAMHVWREMRGTIGESEPSSEFEAYSIQNITFNLIGAYEQTRGKLCRGV
jgi:hypothetical protein